MSDEKDIKDYFKEIDIPKELDFVIEKGITKGKKKRILNNFINTAVAFAAVLALTFVSGNIYNKLNKNRPDDVGQIKIQELKLPSFQSKEQIVDLIKNNFKESIVKNAEKRVFGLEKQSLDNNSNNEGDNSYSKTNNQVEGVEESDIIKTDGKYLYILRDKTLDLGKIEKEVVIAEAYPKDNIKIVSSDVLPKGAFNESIYISADKIILLYDTNVNGELKSIVKIYDKTNIANPKLIREISYSGNRLSDRLIDNQLYLVTQKSLYASNISYKEINKINSLDIEEPIIKDSLDNKENKIEYNDIKYCPGIPTENFITIASVNLNQMSEKSISRTILASSGNMYVSEKNLYISGYNFKDEKTLFLKFALNNGAISLAGTGQAPGMILNQFSMDEYNENFRVTTTNRKENITENNLYIFDKSMNITGKLEGLAKGEKIYSSRFMRDKAYIVTFKQVDPLFVIDLSDSKNPKVLGELKIPGFSTYLHPYDENTLIGFGQNTVEVKENGREFARTEGIKISMFDISDFNNPKEIHKVIIGKSGTYSELLGSHKALLYSKEKNIFGFPITVINDKGQGFFDGAQIYNISKENGFELMAEILSSKDDTLAKTRVNSYSSPLKRLMIIEDNIYFITNQSIKVGSLKDMKNLKVLNY